MLLEDSRKDIEGGARKRRVPDIAVAEVSKLNELRGKVFRSDENGTRWLFQAFTHGFDQ